MGNVEFFIRISWYNYPSAYIILLQAVRAEFELSTLLASAMSATQATDIHFKNNSNESSRFLLDNEHQDVVNVTPDTVLKGSIYLIMFNYLGPIRYKILLLLFFFLSRAGLILSLVPCRRSTCDIAASTACDTSPKYKDITPPSTRNIACVRS